MTETKRDLTADLAICEAATAHVGNDMLTYSWDGDEFRIHTIEGIEVAADISYEGFAQFIVEAQKGWPAALRRAVEAEQMLAEEARMTERLVASMEYHSNRRTAAERELAYLRAGIAAAMTYPPGIIRAKLRKILTEVAADGAK